MLFKYSEMARVNNFYVSGLSHTWVSWYTRSLTDNRSILNEWLVSNTECLNMLHSDVGNIFAYVSFHRNLMEDIDLLRIDSPSFFALGKL